MSDGKIKATLSLDKQNKNHIGIFDLDYTEELELKDTKKNFIRKKVPIDKKAVLYIKKHVSGYARLEVTDKNGKQFEAFSKFDRPENCEYEITIKNGIFSRDEVENLITNFNLKKAKVEDFRGFLNDAMIHLTIKLRQVFKEKELKLGEKKELFHILEKQGKEFLAELNKCYEHQDDHTFLPPHDYNYFPTDILSAIKARKNAHKTAIKKISEDLAKFNEIRYSIKDKKAIPKMVLDRQQSFLDRLYSLISSNDCHFPNDIINSNLQQCYQGTLFSEVSRCISSIRILLALIKFFEPHLIYMQKGNTSKQICWHALFSLREIYKDYFCTTEIEAKNVEQNVQHVGGSNDEYEDKDKSKGRLLEFIYKVMSEIEDKTGAKF